jgi:hypothetical protein
MFQISPQSRQPDAMASHYDMPPSMGHLAAVIAHAARTGANT